MQSVKGKVAVITGASGGIGNSLANRLSELGVNLALIGRNKEKLLDLQKQVTANGVKAEIFVGNLTDDGFLHSLLGDIYQKFSKIDILINNAGIATNSRVEDTDMETYDKIMNINARVPFYLCKDVIKYLRKSDYATIINICSVVATVGYENQSVYSASKHALLGITQSLAKEVYKENIRVHAICPGGVYTDMIKVTRPDLTSDGMIMPDDIADIVEFLLTHRTNSVVDMIVPHRVGKQPF